jgi:hypothetical protein
MGRRVRGLVLLGECQIQILIEEFNIVGIFEDL